MRTDLAGGARAGLIGFAVVTIGLFGVLAARFGGPGVKLDTPVRVHALVPDAQGLPDNADVLVRGVEVGHVTGVRDGGGRARVTPELEHGGPALHPDATIRIGSKTPLGEA